MSLKGIYKDLCFLEELLSTNAKKDELVYMLMNPLFRKVCLYALDPRKKYKTKKLPPFKLQSPMVLSTTDDIFNALDMLVGQKGASKKDKERLAYVASIDKETWEVVQRICNGDLRCGCGVRTINEVLPGLIPFTPYLRCSSSKQLHKAKANGIVQEKANGMYAEMIVEVNKIKFSTRDSHEIHQLDHLKEIFLDTFPDDEPSVFMGELRVYDLEGGILDRATGNGIINKCIQNTASKEEAGRVFYSIWDCIYLEDYNNSKIIDSLF